MLFFSSVYVIKYLKHVKFIHFVLVCYLFPCHDGHVDVEDCHDPEREDHRHDTRKDDVSRLRVKYFLIATPPVII